MAQRIPQFITQFIPEATLLARVEDTLVRNGFSPQVAAPIAATIVACERDGTPSHGLLRLPGYIEAVRTGYADGTVLPEVASSRDSMLVIDARQGFTHLALAQWRDDLMQRASHTGTAVLLIRDAHHFAALWPDIEPFAAHGFIAMSCVTSRARVTGWGGAKAVFGTNASAFACPRANGLPIVWDQAASVMSQGDVLRAARERRPLPEGVGVDADGQPNKPSKCGQFLLLIDPRCAGADVAARVEPLVAAVHDSGTPKLPGARRYARRRQAAERGIELDTHALEILERCANP